jgi:hypothetical protein
METVNRGFALDGLIYAPSLIRLFDISAQPLRPIQLFGTIGFMTLMRSRVSVHCFLSLRVFLRLTRMDVCCGPPALL